MPDTRVYLAKSEQLLDAAEQFRASLQDASVDRESVVNDLIVASRQGAAEQFELHYGMDRSPAIIKPPDNMEDGLSAVLLDVQSANVLMSAGLAVNEAGARGPMLFDEAVAHVEESRATVKANLAESSRYAAAAAAISSATLESARQTFTTNSQSVLDEFVDEAAKVVNSVVEHLKALDPGKVLEAIDRLGESAPTVARVGRLVRLGLEKLQSALDALTGLLGNGTLKAIKDKISEFWRKVLAGDYTRNLLRMLFDVQAIGERIAQTLAAAGADRTASVDAASNALVPLAAGYRRIMKVLGGIVAGLGLAAAVLGYFQVATAWLPLMTGLGYVTVVAGVALVGMEYCGSRRVLKWVHGVDQIAEAIRP